MAHKCSEDVQMQSTGFRADAGVNPYNKSFQLDNDHFLSLAYPHSIFFLSPHPCERSALQQDIDCGAVSKEDRLWSMQRDPTNQQMYLRTTSIVFIHLKTFYPFIIKSPRWLTARNDYMCFFF